MRPTTQAIALACCAGSAFAQLRVANWNVSNYGGADPSRDAAFKTALYTSFSARSFAPDILICQELTSLGGVNAFLTNLNTAPGSPGDWAASAFVDGPDSDSIFYYRTSRVQPPTVTTVAVGGGTPNHPRNIMRYDFRPVGYTGAAAAIACYSTHMKSSTDTDSQARRLLEAQRIRDNAQTLPAGWNFLLSGDLNIQKSSEAAYVELVGSQALNTGRVFDPIKSPGGGANSDTWYSQTSQRFIHTQAPGGTDPQQTGGMDDRFDQILLCASLIDGSGFDYIGNANIAFSTSTWNDPNHSYRCWGNDGSSYNLILNTTTNAMVGPAIAQALHDSTGSDAAGGHLPVYLDMRVPAEVASPLVIDFGQVQQNSLAQQVLTVSNAGDIATWNAAGIANLIYSLSASSGLTAPAGNFTAAPGAPGNAHTLTLNTTTVGPFNGTITINSNAPDGPARLVTVLGSIVAPMCYANCDASTLAPILNVNDFSCFLNRYAAGDSYANCDGSTLAPVLNVNDFSCFLNAYAVGCP